MSVCLCVVGALTLQTRRRIPRWRGRERYLGLLGVGVGVFHVGLISVSCLRLGAGACDTACCGQRLERSQTDAAVVASRARRLVSCSCPRLNSNLHQARSTAARTKFVKLTTTVPSSAMSTRWLEASTTGPVSHCSSRPLKSRPHRTDAHEEQPQLPRRVVRDCRLGDAHSYGLRLQRDLHPDVSVLYRLPN